MKQPDLWNSVDSGCKLINEMCKIKWFGGRLVLDHIGGQIDEQGNSLV